MNGMIPFLILLTVIVFTLLYSMACRIDRHEKRFSDLDAKVDEWILKIIKR